LRHDRHSRPHRCSTRLRPRQHRPSVPRPAARRPQRSGRETKARLQRQAVWHLYPRATARTCCSVGLRPRRRRDCGGWDRPAWPNAAEVMATIRDLRDRNIVLRSLREGIDTANATGRMVAGVLASLAELELELGRERRAAAREARRARGQSIERPRALDKSKSALAQRMHASGESASTIAATLGVSRATVYRVLAEQTAQGD
jgi:Resolvase, N terminal domain/Helix-turn-helix domain of resolvase